MRRWLRALVGLNVAVLGLAMATSGTALAVPPGPAERHVLVLAVSWPDHPIDKTIGEVAASVHQASGWLEQASANEFGTQQFAGWHVQATSVDIPTPPMGGLCVIPEAVRDLARQAAVDQGIPEVGSRQIVVYHRAFQPFNCNSVAPGDDVVLNGSTNPTLIAHELGHTLHLAHSNALACTDSTGVRVPLSSMCATIDYGDTATLMGSQTHGEFVELSAPHLDDLGWLGARKHVVSSAGGIFDLKPIESHDGPGARALVVDDLYLEYRPRIGDPGVRVYRQGVVWPAGLSQSILLDMTPNTDHHSPGLLAGSTWVHPFTGTTITTQQAGPSGAVVTITKLTVPDVKGLAQQVANQRLVQAGYAVGPPSSTVDPTCNKIGQVVGQVPLAGTVAPVGTAVRLTIAARPKPPKVCP